MEVKITQDSSWQLAAETKPSTYMKLTTRRCFKEPCKMMSLNSRFAQSSVVIPRTSSLSSSIQKTIFCSRQAMTTPSSVGNTAMQLTTGYATTLSKATSQPFGSLSSIPQPTSCAAARKTSPGQFGKSASLNTKTKALLWERTFEASFQLMWPQMT